MPRLFEAKEIVGLAIKIEENGEEFYTRLANSMKNLQVKETFEFLAEDERNIETRSERFSRDLENSSRSTSHNRRILELRESSGGIEHIHERKSWTAPSKEVQDSYGST